jgi:hypothetical protein
VKIEGSFAGTFQQELGHYPAREIRNDVVTLPVASSIRQWVTPHAEAVGHVREMLLAKGQRASAIGVIGFAEKEDGYISFRHGTNYKPGADREAD